MNTEMMKEAINIAQKVQNEVPIAAVITKDDKIIASAVNLKESLNLPTAHAEILAIHEACDVLNSWRLDDCSIYVTLEPCPMCASAIIQSRIKNVYFGAYDSLYGAFGGAFDIRKIHNSDITVVGGILEQECSSLIKDFFKSAR